MAKGAVFTVTGSFKRTQSFLTKMQSPRGLYSDLSALAQRGVDALMAGTPKDTGLTAMSWSYEIEVTDTTCSIWWTNTNSNNGVPIALIIQLGHGTGTGGYVSGRDYINPALKPIFDEIANGVWRRVTSA